MSAAILVISKPISPPWNDSSKNLVKDLVTGGSRYHYRILTPRGYHLDDPRVTSEAVYATTGTFTPPLLQNARVVARLLRRDDTAITHFFFAPNSRSSFVARLCLTLRRRRAVQTVCSTPARFDPRLLFADRVVVLSEHTRRRFVDAGVHPDRLTVIPPGIHIPDPPTPAARAKVRSRLGLPPDLPLIVYPGDYQFSSAADTFARAILHLRDLPVSYVFACRIKQRESLAEEQRIRAMLAAESALSRVRMLRQVDDMIGLLAASDLCVLPAESLYAKMDLPLVLLEAMAVQVPVVVADSPPINELAHPGAVETVPPADPAALAGRIRQLVSQSGGLEQMGRRARTVARERYAIQEVARRQEALYDELLAE